MTWSYYGMGRDCGGVAPYHDVLVPAVGSTAGKSPNHGDRKGM